MFKTFAFYIATMLAHAPGQSAPAKPSVKATTPTAAKAPAKAPAAKAPAAEAPAAEAPAATPAPASAPAPAAAPSRVAAGPTAADVVAGVQKFYATITSVKAKFRQEVTNATFGRSDVSDGQLWISKPGKMRWDYFTKRKGKVTTSKNFISDGSDLYVVDHDNKQVIQKNLKQDLLPTAITFLYGKGDLAADFDAVIDTAGTYGTKADHVLKLTPKAPSAQYKYLYLVVDPSNFRVKESIIIDSASNKNHFRFYEPQFGAPVKASWFEFNPKSVKNYRIVDGDQSPGPTAPTAPKPAK